MIRVPRLAPGQTAQAETAAKLVPAANASGVPITTASLIDDCRESSEFYPGYGIPETSISTPACPAVAMPIVPTSKTR